MRLNLDKLTILLLIVCFVFKSWLKHKLFFLLLLIFLLSSIYEIGLKSKFILIIVICEMVFVLIYQTKVICQIDNT